jgi:NAD(P)H-flavin reductase
MNNSIKSKSEIVIAAEYPNLTKAISLANKLKKDGHRVIAIFGAQNKENLPDGIEDKENYDELLIATLDGSKGSKGNIVQLIKKLFEVIEQSTHTQYPESIYYLCSNETALKIKKLAQDNNINSISV